MLLTRGDLGHLPQEIVGDLVVNHGIVFVGRMVHHEMPHPRRIGHENTYEARALNREFDRDCRPTGCSFADQVQVLIDGTSGVGVDFDVR